MSDRRDNLRLENWKRATAIALTVLGVSWLWVVWNAPGDAETGIIGKILFLHPPQAFAAYAGFIGAAIAGAFFLARGNERADRLASACAEVGVVFCTLVLITGPIWAKGTWGKWWTWDPRLTVTLILYLTYVAYLLLRSFTEGSERAARFAAVYSILAVLLIPLNYKAIEWLGGSAMHPPNFGPDPERDTTVGAGLVQPAVLGGFATFAAFAFLLVRRFEVGELRAARAEQLALAAQREDA